MNIPFIGKSPIRRSIAANFFGIGVALLNQLLLVPFYLKFWGTELYSDWIVISALTAIFSMSDIGLNNVVQNEFAIKFSSGKIEECRSLIISNICIIAITSSVCIFGSIVYIIFFDFGKQLGLHVITIKEASIVFVFLVIQLFLVMFSGIENAVYRACHKTDRAIMMDQIGKLCQFAITFVCLYSGSSMTTLVVLLIMPTLFLIAIKHYDSRKWFTYRFKFAYIDLKMIKSLLLPSISFMSFPLGNAIILQGYTLLVNKLLGADSVVLYNTTRTMCNFVTQVLSTIKNSAWPEYSIAYGKEDYATMRYLYRKSLKMTTFGSIAIGVLLIILGPYIYQIWTHGQVHFSYSLMTAFICTIIMENIWSTSSITFVATNNHKRLGLLFVLTASLSILLAYYIFLWSDSLSMMVLSLLLMHITLSAYCIKAGLKLTKNSVF